MCSEEMKFEGIADDEEQKKGEENGHGFNRAENTHWVFGKNSVEIKNAVI